MTTEEAIAEATAEHFRKVAQSMRDAMHAVIQREADQRGVSYQRAMEILWDEAVSEDVP